MIGRVLSCVVIAWILPSLPCYAKPTKVAKVKSPHTRRASRARPKRDDLLQLKQYTPTTRATRKLLLADLIESHQRGYTIDRSEGLESIQCLAAPILDARGYPIAGITIVGPRFRVTEDRFEEIGLACVEAAQQVQRRMNA